MLIIIGTWKGRKWVDQDTSNTAAHDYFPSYVGNTRQKEAKKIPSAPLEIRINWFIDKTMKGERC